MNGYIVELFAIRSLTFLKPRFPINAGRVQNPACVKTKNVAFFNSYRTILVLKRKKQYLCSMEKIAFIQAHRALFWSVNDAQLPNISDTLLVETILNYGSLEDVKSLFQLMGIGEVARLFRQSTVERVRNNYFPEVLNFFNLYFNRHAPIHTV